ncbi:MAG: zinc metallopeptidase [Clostridia bacterium]|nr:zinc metallopeptidase [Clostridia bacterium]
MIISYSYMLLVIPALIFSIYAQFKVKGTFDKYSRYSTYRGLTGAEAARQILYNNGLYDVAVEPVAGSLTDHYDPKKRVVRLSETVYSSTSVAAIGVAAHETGHAIQHQVGYAPLNLRSNLVPVASIGSMAGPYMAIFGLIFQMSWLAQLGIILFTVAVAFYLVTLPVEFNASKRAVAVLESRGILSASELVPTKKVLNAAAMTYVASALTAMANLIHLVLSFMGSSSDD